MSELFLHEALYRGADALERLGRPRVTVCGAGAVGSYLADTLAPPRVRHITVIDSDRVEAHNVGTQTYALAMRERSRWRRSRPRCSGRWGSRSRPCAST